MSTTLSPHVDHAGRRDRRDRGARSWLMPSRRFPLIVVLVTVAFVIAGWLRRWTVDDAFIVFRVVDHVLSGHGPVFNVGERVEAVTSPLWLGVLVVARALMPVPVEWLAVIIGLMLAGAGVALAMVHAGILASRGDGGRQVPAGMLVWLGLPPAWDFATSGLESGLGMAWFGGCCWGLARLADGTARPTGRAPLGLAVLAGLGPVIRPDFGVFAVVFVVAVLLCADLGRRAPWAVLVSAIAAPAVVEIARMGYYASLLPNTLLAKEASLPNWSQGWWYLVDFVAPYALVVPLAVVALLIARATRDDDRRRRIARLAPAVGGVLYGLAVVRGGGDFMHARLLMPALFAVLVPVALVRVRATVDVLAVAVLGCWALLSAVALRAPTGADVPDRGISDQRAFYVEMAGTSNPVTLNDYRDYARVTHGARAARLAAAGQRALIVDERVHPLRDGAAPAVVYEAGAVGLASAAAGDDVYVLDRLGLGDAYTARQRLETRRRPGHDKPLPMAWVWGRYGVMSAVPPDQAGAARAARTAMACAPLRQLDEAITQPLTARRFLDNLVAAPRLTMLRFPSEPQAAVDALCRANAGS